MELYAVSYNILEKVLICSYRSYIYSYKMMLRLTRGAKLPFKKTKWDLGMVSSTSRIPPRSVSEVKSAWLLTESAVK